MARVWVQDVAAWNLHLCYNLEWMVLSQHLQSVNFRAAADSWIWTIDPSSSSSVKSLIDDLVGADNNHVVNVYSAIWLDRFPKKIKNFLWEFSLNTADRLQHRMPYMVLSPSWCLMSHIDSESAAHLFIHCFFCILFLALHP